MQLVLRVYHQILLWLVNNLCAEELPAEPDNMKDQVAVNPDSLIFLVLFMLMTLKIYIYIPLFFLPPFSFIHQYLRGQYLLTPLRVQQLQVIRGRPQVNQDLLVLAEIVLCTLRMCMLPRLRLSTTEVNLYFFISTSLFFSLKDFLTLYCYVKLAHQLGFSAVLWLFLKQMGSAIANFLTFMCQHLYILK